MSSPSVEQPSLSLNHEGITIRFTHQHGDASYYVKDDCYSPLDIRNRFAGSSPHTLVSSSSSSPHRNSPDEQGGPTFQDAEESPLVVVNTGVLYTSDSPASASSLRSEDELANPEVTQGLDEVRAKRRKQNKPLKYDTDQDPSTSKPPRVPEEYTTSPLASPTVYSTPNYTTQSAGQLMLSSDNVPREEGERIDGVSTSVSSPGSLSASHGQSSNNFAGRTFPTGPTGVQIFNTDAYCELCNREFCNKYFLKTHKANKHGVYDPSLPASSPQARMSEDDGMISPQPAQEQPEVQLNAPPFPITFFPSNPFLVDSKEPIVLSKEVKGGNKESADRTEAITGNSEEVQHLLQQRLLQMYAQNLALQQMYQESAAASRQGPPFPGMLHMPGMLHPLQPGGLNMLNYFHPQQHHGHVIPWTAEHRHSTPHDFSPPPIPNTVLPTIGKRSSASVNDVNVCDICQKKMSSHNFLRIHRKKKHGLDQEVKIEGTEPFPQRVCPKSREAVRPTFLETALASQKSPALNVTSPSQHYGEYEATTELTNATDESQLVFRKKSRSKKREIALERQLLKHTAHTAMRREGRESKERRSSADVEDEDGYGFQTPPMARQLLGLPEIAQPMQFSNLQRLLQDSLRDPRTGRRETFRCNECSQDFATRYFLESHCMKHHSRHGASTVSSSTYELPSEATVLDLSTPKSRSRRSGENDSPSTNVQTPPRKRPLLAVPFREVRKDKTDESPGMEEGVVTPGGGSGGLDLECYCTKCSREYCSKYFLRTHLKKEHQMTTEQYLEEVRQVYPDVWQQYMAPPDAIDSSVVMSAGGSGTPSRRNWCRYCKKDFCNKYFFKTHMQKMHNEVISPVTSNRNGKKRSKGVPCDICNKHLCSKYFLRIHKRNTHGIMDALLDTPCTDGSPAYTPSISQMPSSDPFRNQGESGDGDDDDDESRQKRPQAMFLDEEGENGISCQSVVDGTGEKTVLTPPRSPTLSSLRNERSLSPTVSLHSEQTEDWVSSADAEE